jgi:hypothetical protein
MSASYLIEMTPAQMAEFEKPLENLTYKKFNKDEAFSVCDICDSHDGCKLIKRCYKYKK